LPSGTPAAASDIPGGVEGGAGAGISNDGIGAISEDSALPSTSGGAYEILDGVRRSKAAEIKGDTHIDAHIVSKDGQTIGKGKLPLDALRSPKKAIDTSGAGLDRWLDTLRKTMSGSKAPPIQVTPGSKGTPIKDVEIE
jgi:hypothetical protein